MRTTVNLDPSLLDEAKAVAARRRCSLGRVIDEALRDHLARQPVEDGAPRFRLRVFGGTPGLRPGVDLEDKELLAELDGERDLPWRR